MSPSEILDPREPYLLPLLILIATRAAFWLLLPHATEDAYITFRYARNLAGGNGLIYNPGERVFGFTSPLWTLWNALGILIAGNPVIWSRAWSIAADAVSLLVLGGLLRRHLSRSSAWCFTFFFAAWPYFSAVAVSGMECSALLATIAVAAAAVESASPASGPALAAVAMMRPEGLAAAALLALGARWRDRVVAAVLTAASLVALQLYYGTVIPQSVIAKSQIYGAHGPWAARYWWEWLVPFPMGRRTGLSDTVPLSVIAVILAPAFALGIGALWRLRRSGLALAAAAALVFWIGYSLLGVAYFWWYLMLPLAGVSLVAACGLPRVVRGPAIPAAAAIYVIGVWTVTPMTFISRAGIEAFSFGRAADLMRAHCRPGDRVLLEPIGIIGYTAPVVVVDEVGLVSPRVARRRGQGPGWYADVESTERPDWIVLRAGVLQSGTAFAGLGAPFRDAVERDSLLARYQVVDRGLEDAGVGALVILKRLR